MATQFRDYYQTLGVARDATPAAIKRAFRQLARENHPDTNGNDPAKLARFKEINEAHEVLTDPEKRKHYDELGENWQQYEQWEKAGKPGRSPVGRPRGGSPAGPPGSATHMDAADLDELFGSGNGGEFSSFFETFFGATSGQGGGGRRPPARRGDNVETDVEVSLAEAIAGTQRTIELTTAGKKRRLEIAIPAGIADGARVRAAGQGAPGGAGNGDLVLRVHIRADPQFSRRDADLTVRVPVPLRTALLGGEIRVPTPRGRSAQLTVPPGTQNGTRLRLRGLGMARASGGNGDLFAEVDVRLPLPLDDATRRLAEGLAPPTKG